MNFGIFSDVEAGSIAQREIFGQELLATVSPRPGVAETVALNLKVI